MNGCVDNSEYDLEKLLEKLLNDDHVLDKEHLRIQDIPYCNAEPERTQYIAFKYLPSFEEYQVIAGLASFDVAHYILNNLIDTQNCKKKM